MSDPLKDKRVKDCPDCKVVIMMGAAFTFYCSKHSRFGAIAQRPTKYAPDSLKAVAKSLPKSRKNKKVLPAVSG